MGYKSVNPNALTVGEAWTSTQEVVEYTGHEIDIARIFDLAQGILGRADAGSASIYSKNQQEVYDSFPRNQYATFITNHDQNRVMSRLRRDEAKARLAASVLLTGTSVPFIYYGEEIGMDEDIRRPRKSQKYSEWGNKRMGLMSKPSLFAYFPIRCTSHLAGEREFAN